jgi:hypothetical protein
MDTAVKKSVVGQPRKYPVRSDCWLEEVREVYRYMVNEHALSGDQLLILKGACSALNRARQAEIKFKEEGHGAKLKHGHRENESATEVRERERMVFLRCIRALGIDYNDIPKTVTLRPLKTI